MKKLLVVFGVAFLSTQVVMAQTDSKAKAVLDGVSKKVNGLKTLKADFAIKIAGAKVKDTKKGTATIKGQKYHVMISDQEIICDTKTVWTYNKATKEVQVSSYNPTEQSMTPAKLLTNFYDKEYSYKYGGEKKEGARNLEVVELSPKDNSKQVSKIELFVDKVSSLISGGNIWQKNGNESSYTISNYVLNKDVPDSYFTWNQSEHPGVEVVDLR